MSERVTYRPPLAHRLRAFLLTDRVGHTIASTLGLIRIFGHLVIGRLRRLIGMATERR